MTGRREAELREEDRMDLAPLAGLDGDSSQADVFLILGWEL